MRVGLVSDLHEHFPDLNHVNLDGLIIAGDISFKPYMDVRAEQEMWRTKFIPWLQKLNISNIYITLGNHDCFPYIQPTQAIQLCERASYKNSINLYQLGHGKILDKYVGYCPFSLAFCDWVYNAEEKKLWEMFKYLGKCNIIVSHGPPYGYGDSGDKYNNLGSKALLRYIEDYEPEYVFCGHLHSGRGIYKYNYTTIVNCAFTNENYNPINKIFVWDTDCNTILEESII